MGKSSPKTPDPGDTAQAQAKANRIDQFTPFGNIVFSGPNRREATITLSPEQQRILEQQQTAALLLGQSGIDLAGLLPTAPSAQFQPGDFGAQRSSVEQAQFQRAMALLDPQFQLQERRLRQRLANQGLPQGGEAFTGELERFEDTRNRALEQAALASVLAGGQEQSRLFGLEAQTEQIRAAQRAAQLNEILTRLGLSQVQQPNFFAPGQVDVLGPHQLRMQGDLAAMQAQQQLFGGLLGLGGTLGGAAIMAPALSDIRIKTDIRRVGMTDDGLPVYVFRYRGDPVFHMGVMAQDVIEVKPEAVALMPDGTLGVYYGRL